VVSVSSGFGNPDFGSAETISYTQGVDDLAMAPDGKRVYAISRTARKLLVINSDYGDVAAPNPTFNTILDELDVVGQPVGIAVDPAGERAYIATASGMVEIWDVELGSGTFHRQVGLLESPLPSLQGAIEVDRTGLRVLALAGTGELLIWDASDPTSPPIESPVSSDPRDITIDPQGTVAYVTDGVGLVSVVLPSSGVVTQSIPVSGEPYALALTPSGKRGYAADRANDELAAIDFDAASPSFRTVTTSLPVGVQPVDVVASPDADYLLVIEQASQQLRIVGIAEGPEITNIEPRWVRPGDMVTITGSGFAFAHPEYGSASATNVYFGQTSVRAEYATNTRLFVKVPSDFAGGSVRVGRTGAALVGLPSELFSNPVSLRVLDQPNGPADTAVFLGSGNGYDWDDVGVVATVATSPTGKFMLAVSLSDIAYMIDTDRNSPTFGQIIGDIQLTANPKPDRMVIAPDGDHAYYAGLDNEIHILDTDPESPTYLTEIGEILWTLTGQGSQGFPDHMEIVPNGFWLVVSDELNDQIYLCDLDEESPTYHETLSETGPIGYATGMAVHPTGLSVNFTATTGFMHVVSLDPFLFEGTVFMEEVGSIEWAGLRDVAFTPDGERAYILRREGGPTGAMQLLAFDTTDPNQPVQIGQPQDIVTGGTATDGRIKMAPTGDRLIVDIPAVGLTVDLYVGEELLPGTIFTETDQLNINGTIDKLDVAWMPDGTGFWSASRGDTGIRYVDLVDVQKADPVSGFGQVGVAGQPLPAPIVLRANAGPAGPSAGAVAQVRINAGGGTLGNGLDYQWIAADENGEVAVHWTLGPVADTGVPQNALTVSWNNGFSSADGITATSVADPNTLPLSQVQVLPVADAADVSLTTTVQVVFSRAVDPLTVDASSLILRKQGDGTPVPVAYGFASGNTAVSMVPLAALDPSTVFEIETTAAIADESGGALTNPTVTTFTTQAPPPLTISAISPPAATVGTQIVISGAGFDSTPADNTVNFGAATATAVSGGPGFITVYVPLGAETGSLTVEANAQTSNPRNFTVLVPETAPLDEVFSSVETGISVQSVAVTPDGAKAYTVSTETNEVLPIDLFTFTNLPAIAVGSAPQGVIIHPNGGTAYVTNYGSGSVSVIDTTTDAVTTTINVGTNPVELVASPVGDRLYVVNELDQTLSVIDIDASSATYHSVLATVPTTKSTKGAAIRPDGTVLYLGTSDGYIEVTLEPNAYGVLVTRNTGKSTKAAAITPDGSLLLLVTTSNEVLVVDVSVGGTNAVLATVPTTKSTKGAAITPDGSLLYLLQEETNEVLVVELNITAPVGVYRGVGPVVVQPVFVKSIPVAESPAVLAFDPSGSGLAVIAHERASGLLSFLNTSSIPRGEFETTVELAPLELNDVTRGFYMNVYLIMPDDVDASGVDLASIRMNGSLPAAVDQCELVDRDGDGDLDVLLRFERREVLKLFPRADSVEVYISGISEPGRRSFTGVDTMTTRLPTIIRPYGNQLLLGGVPFNIQWLEPGGFDADCVHIHHSAVNGQWWRWVAYDLDNIGEFLWNTPPIFSHNSIIEVVFYRNIEGTHEHAIIPIDPTQPEPDEKEIVAIALSENFRLKDPAVPVVMQGVDLGVDDGAGRIEWSIADPLSVEGFHVFRADSEDGIYERVNVEVVEAVSTPDGPKFVFEDESIYANRDYFYMLQEDRGLEPGFEHGPYKLNWALENALYQNRPNSFNPRTTISFSIAQDGHTKLAVYNLAGRLVDVIVDETLRADTHEFTWDGKDRGGRSVASGVYVYRLSAPGGFVAAKKMTLVR
jgi:YVTN family beta-propeller protein